MFLGAFAGGDHSALAVALASPSIYSSNLASHFDDVHLPKIAPV